MALQELHLVGQRFDLFSQSCQLLLVGLWLNGLYDLGSIEDDLTVLGHLYYLLLFGGLQLLDFGLELLVGTDLLIVETLKFQVLSLQFPQFLLDIVALKQGMV